MTRLSHTFGCGSLTLAGTLDTAPGSAGLLIVSGGNEIRSGAFGGQADMAARMLDAGAVAYLTKVGNPQALIAAVRVAAAQRDASKSIHS